MGRSSPYVSLEEERRTDERDSDEATAPIPFFILTGFLGAGKTTLLNRLLSAPQGQRIAVLVNDVGQINVDRKLIAAEAGDLIELSGGCVCCQIDLQRDLFTGVDDLVRRAKPDVVILETTGIADPGVLLAAFDEVESRRRRVRPAGVICVVDTEVGLAGEARIEWRAQLAAADRVVLSKTERAQAAAIVALHAALEVLSPGIERAAFPSSEEGTQALARFLLSPRVVRRPMPSAVEHRHSQLTISSFVDESALVEAPLMALIESLGSALVRMKGHARLIDDAGSRWAYIERAGLRTEVHDRPPPPGQTRAELVFILDAGTIDEESLRRRLWACRAG